MCMQSVAKRPEASTLNMNESEFNFIDDSQINDIIEVSNFAKHSEMCKLTDKYDHQDHNITKQYRKINNDTEKNKKENRNTYNFEIFNSEMKHLKDNIFHEPSNFPDLDTSDIAIDAPHHLDKEFGDKNDSFIDIQEQNSFESSQTKDIFDLGVASCSPIEFKLICTPQVLKSKGRKLFTSNKEHSEQRNSAKNHFHSEVFKNENINYSQNNQKLRNPNLYSKLNHADNTKQYNINEIIIQKNEQFKEGEAYNKSKVDINQPKIYDINSLLNENNTHLNKPYIHLQNYANKEPASIKSPYNKTNFQEKELSTKILSTLSNNYEDNKHFNEIQKPTESFKSSIVSSCSEFSNCDKISERLAEIITEKDEEKEYDENTELTKLGHK